MDCLICKGEGKLSHGVCPACKGTGTVTVKEKDKEE